MKAIRDNSIPKNKGNNAVIERTSGHILEGTRTLLNQSGLPTIIWPYAARYFCLACNASEQGGRGSAWKKRFGQYFTKQLLPFGCSCRTFTRRTGEYNGASSARVPYHGDRASIIATVPFACPSPTGRTPVMSYVIRNIFLLLTKSLSYLSGLKSSANDSECTCKFTWVPSSRNK